VSVLPPDSQPGEDPAPYERIDGTASAGVVLTCEHASEALPRGYAFTGSDARLAGTHWAVDLGARELVLALAAELAAPAVLSTTSRLFVDANREEGHPDLFRGIAEGAPVLLNQALDDGERARRVERYHRPFHSAVDACMAQMRPKLLFSIHTFTPSYEGILRTVELGVLFNHEEQLARVLGSELARLGYLSQENEPWSGRAGLIYSAESHALRWGARPLELEVRQDLATDARYREAFVPALASAVRAVVSALAQPAE
jgi:predicted N-formylglutamate amidohydrolase